MKSFHTKWSLAILFLAAVVLTVEIFFLPATSDTSLAPMHADIVLTENGFMPNEVTIQKGGSVTFSTETGQPFWPASNPHPQHTIYREFDPFHPIAPNEQWTFEFDKAADWNFHDHLRSYFLGTIHVVE